MKPRILYLEDDETLAFLTTDHLRMNGYEVDHVADGASALHKFAECNYDICVLDVVVPELDGLAVAEKIRKLNAEIAIVFLSARAMAEDRIKALKIGADDYLVKPFKMEELILKIEVFLRRTGKVKVNPKSVFQFNSLLFNPGEYAIESSNGRTKLTSRETELLKYLCEHPNEVLKREDILLAVWGDDDYFMGRSLDVFISKLRKYISQDPTLEIENIHSVGFKFKTHQS